MRRSSDEAPRRNKRETDAQVAPPAGSLTGNEIHGAEAQINLLGYPPSRRANQSCRNNGARPLPNSVWHAPKASPVSNAGCARVSDAVEQRTGSHSQGVSSDRKSRQRRDIRIRRDGESRRETTNLVRIHLRISPCTGILGVFTWSQAQWFSP